MPELPAHLNGVWRAFVILSRRRFVGFAPAPIPLSEMLAYVDGFGISEPQRSDYIYLLMAMDDEFLSQGAGSK